jgi:spore germination protein
VNGYLTDAAAETLAETLPELTFLSPFSYRADAAGALTPTFSVPPTDGAAGTAELLTITNLKSAGGFSSAVAHAILTDEAAQSAFLQNVGALLQSGRWYGVNLDFEYVYPFDRGSYNQFLRRFADFLHARGALLVTALAPKQSDGQAGLLYAAHDYAAHGAAADYVVLMTYEWGYTYGPPMAVAPLPQVRAVLDYAVSVVPRDKLLLGVPLYGYDWPLPYVRGETRAESLSPRLAVERALAYGAEILYDERAQSPYYYYTDRLGRQHAVWFEDARSMDAKLRLIAEYRLRGAGFWSLTRDAPQAWTVLNALYDVARPA